MSALRFLVEQIHKAAGNTFDLRQAVPQPPLVDIPLSLCSYSSLIL
jgi:hypothetical protein